MIQRNCKGYLVSKQYFRERAKISIDVTLGDLFKMKEQFGTQLSNLVRFHWRVYLRVKQKKAAAEKKRKAAEKAKAKKGKKGTSYSSTPLKTSGSSVKERKGSIVKTPSKDAIQTPKTPAVKEPQ